MQVCAYFCIKYVAFLYIAVVYILYKYNYMEIIIYSDGDFIVYYLSDNFLDISGNIFPMCNQNLYLKDTNKIMFSPTKHQITE